MRRTHGGAVRLLILALVFGAGLAGSAQAGGSAQSPGARGARFHDDASPQGQLPAVPGEDRGGSVTGQAVIGSDDRTRISPATAFPFSAIAFLELFDAGMTLTGTCTGTFIGPDALLTAGHCLWRDGAWTQHIRVVPGKDDQAEPFGSVFATDWWVADAYINSGGLSDFDWGVIRLANGDLAARTHWMQVAVLKTPSLEEDGFTPAVVGYPSDRPLGTMWGHSQPRFAIVEPFHLFYDIDTAPGQSGSAIWSVNPSKPYFGAIVGIHTRGASAGNSGSRIDQQLLDDLLEGCRQMKCTIDSVVETGDGPAPTTERPYRAVGIAVARD